MSDAPTPADVLASGDPGDETVRRFAYQWTYAAIVACGMFDETSGIVEVFCEHHEDILIKYKDGTFCGCQVKTRQAEEDPWKATEEPIVNAVCRFAKLEHQFPGVFREFRLSTNHAFFTGKRTGTDLPYLLDLARMNDDETSADAKLVKYIRKVAATAQCPEPTALAILKKTKYDHSLPKFGNIKQDLRDAIHEAFPGAADATIPLLRQAADALIAECQRAASLDHAQCLPPYFGVTIDADDALVRERIDGKRLTCDRIHAVLNGVLVQPTLLNPGGGDGPKMAPEGKTRMEKKLTAGGLSAVSVNAAKDLQAAAVTQALEWQAKFGSDPGLKRYKHISTLVLRDCADAHEAAKTNAPSFGPEMLRELRTRFQARRTTGGATLFECLDEHLEGFAYELTTACKVWWSEPFDLQEGV